MVILVSLFGGSTILFSSSYTILHPHQQCTKMVSTFLTNTNFVLLCFLDSRHPDVYEGDLGALTYELLGYNHWLTLSRESSKCLIPRSAHVCVTT